MRKLIDGSYRWVQVGHTAVYKDGTVSKFHPQQLEDYAVSKQELKRNLKAAVLVKDSMFSDPELVALVTSWTVDAISMHNNILNYYRETVK